MPEIDGAALKDWRERSGFTAKDFAADAKISLQYLCDIERGERRLSRRPDLIDRFAKLLNIPVTRLHKPPTEVAS